jgi:hypothetical protein
MPNGQDRPFFFVHVMKTGGTTFRAQAARNFAADEMFPDPHEDVSGMEKIVRSVEVRQFVDMDPERRDRVAFFSGHVPFAAAELTSPGSIKLAVLRDPVERTLSYLRHCRRDHPEHHGKALEEIYEDPWFFPRFIENHQTKIFSMTVPEMLQGQTDEVFDRQAPAGLPDEIADDPEFRRQLAAILRREGPTAQTLLRLADRAPTEVVTVDDERLRGAMDNLEQVDVLGLTDELDVMLTSMADRYAWDVDDVVVLNATSGTGVAPSFRARIAADNAADIELYDHARRICHAASTRPRNS